MQGMKKRGGNTYHPGSVDKQSNQAKQTQTVRQGTPNPKLAPGKVGGNGLLDTNRETGPRFNPRKR